ncbi:MAG: hypothetical protein WBD09_11435 [Halobacteriota archaeon]
MGREDEREGVAGRAKGKSFKSKKKEDNRRDGKRRKGVKKDKNLKPDDDYKSTKRGQKKEK